jgi:hypothetical protein
MKDTEEGEYNSKTDEYDEIVTVTDGTVIGISIDSDGDFFFLVETENGAALESWNATLCYLEDPR